MDWRQLPPLAGIRAFAAFVDKGNLQAAGAALNVSHAAISQQLRALEDHLGLSLVDRSGRALELTAEGKVLADAALEGFGAITGAVQELTGAEQSRPLHISTTNSFAASWLMPRIAGFRALHPQVELVIDPNPAPVELTPGGVDLAIRYGDGVWPGVDSELLMVSPIVGVAAPGLLEQGSEIEDLAKVTWFQELGTSEASEWLAAKGVETKASTVTVPSNLAIDAARAGEGIAVATKTAVQCDLDTGHLVCLFEDRPDSGYFLVTRPGIHRPPLRKFAAWLRTEAKS